jgi:Flp pilus assembly protein TadG
MNRLRRTDGQALVEFALVLPLLLVVVLGIVEIGYALLDQHVVTKLTREGSNLISRDTTLQDASAAMKTMKTRPVNFDDGSRLIFSVLKRVATVGTANFDKVVLYQRYEYGTLAASSALKTKGTGAFGGAPNYEAVNSDNDTNLQLATVPSSLVLIAGGMAYVTEVYTTHVLITPLDRFGITVPGTLYSIAYF